MPMPFAADDFRAKIGRTRVTPIRIAPASARPDKLKIEFRDGMRHLRFGLIFSLSLSGYGAKSLPSDSGPLLTVRRLFFSPRHRPVHGRDEAPSAFDA